MKALKKKKAKKLQGQTVVEYLLIVVMIAGVAGAVYVAMKRYLPGPMQRVKASMEGDGSTEGASAGSGQKPHRHYYQNVEFKSK